MRQSDRKQPDLAELKIALASRIPGPEQPTSDVRLAAGKKIAILVGRSKRLTRCLARASWGNGTGEGDERS